MSSEYIFDVLNLLTTPLQTFIIQSFNIIAWFLSITFQNSTRRFQFSNYMLLIRQKIKITTENFVIIKCELCDNSIKVLTISSDLPIAFHTFFIDYCWRIQRFGRSKSFGILLCL